ncbi:MAG: chemotaxis protein CheA [Gammaproteobacteria bacterium]|nr:MAG: chemotaxis protein CheA [Gammaproteobacteria bacterium]
MSIDISQFHDVFFEESFEGLDAMESGLLNLDVGAADVESINTIFRAAHSIKGGAGTFGFMDVSEFTHVMETLLDEMRNGERDVSSESTNLLLETVDVLREMLIAVQQKTDTDAQRIAEIRQKLEAMLAGEAAEASGASGNPIEVDLTADMVESTQITIGWNINFRPHQHLLQTGNDPVRMLRELETLGELAVVVDDSKLPPFSDLEPEDSYLSWQLTLMGDIPKEEVVEIFEWVDDECDLAIEEIVGESTVAVENTAGSIKDESADHQVPIIVVEQAATKQVEDAKPKASSATPATTSIRVGTDKVDSLINLVGELVITQSMLGQIGDNFTQDMLPQLIDGLAQLEQNTREMQESIMRIRMLPISFAFNRFPRLVHDLSGTSGKKVELKLSGEQTELDKTVMEKIGDPLVHLVRNSLDHGLEMPEVRLAAGKEEIGQLHLNAFHQGGNIIIEISDDGAGLNEDKIFNKAVEKGLVDASEVLSPDKIHELIFLPGFSTADVVTDISGRGVGMDVVRKNILSLGGSVSVVSKKGEGSTFTIRLPLTLAIMDGQTIRVAGENYIIPLVSIIESLEIKSTDVKRLSGKGELYPLRDEYVPIIRLYEIFGLHPKSTDLEDGLLVIVEGAGQKVGLFIDDLLGQQQVVIKSLETNYRKVLGLSGATILGDGTVALILDVPGLMTLYKDPSLAKVLINDEQVA